MLKLLEFLLDILNVVLVTLMIFLAIGVGVAFLKLLLAKGLN